MLEIRPSTLAVVVASLARDRTYLAFWITPHRPPIDRRWALMITSVSCGVREMAQLKARPTRLA